MLHLMTGLPGAGKTQWTLWHLIDRSRSEDRVVYYHGIKILKSEMFEKWVLLDDPKAWHELPDGAIILIDEAQDTFGAAPAGSKPPEFISKLAQHRHKGYDIYMITQMPRMVHLFVRGLTNEHRHFIRPWGQAKVNVHFWPKIKDNCDSARSDSIKEVWSYKPELFEAYVSATVHTHKRKLPARVHLMWILPLVGLCAFGWLAYLMYGNYRMGKDASAHQQEVSSTAHSGGQVVSGSSGGGGGAGGSNAKTLAAWVADQQPRIQGLPHTAPMYDEVTKPVRAPYPAGCIATEMRCTCYSQQATRIATDDQLCRQIAATGYFVAWDADKGEGRREQRAVVASAMSERSEMSEYHVEPSSGAWGGIPARHTWGGVPAR